MKISRNFRQILSVSFLYLTMCGSFTEQRNVKFKVQMISPNLTVIARGQALKLIVAFNGTDDVLRHVSIRWYFRDFLSKSVKKILSIDLYNGHIVYNISRDPRASAEDKESLRLVNTTVNDTGIYWYRAFSKCSSQSYSLRFEVIVEDEPKAEITCSRNVKLTSKANFSCWCHALGVHLVSRASWMKNGQILHGSTNFRQKLTLLNVEKNEAGTYICRAQIYAMVDEITTEITVYYSPRIIFFQSTSSKNNSIILTCLADGLPVPTYAIHGSDAMEVPGVLNGVVIIDNFSFVDATFTCLAKNFSLGKDERRLNIHHRSLKVQKKPPKRCFHKETEWYILFISVMVGIIFGVVLSFGSYLIHKRKAVAKQHKTQQVLDTHPYAYPVVPTTSSADYQELNDVRLNEENPYQTLHLTTRMKSTAKFTCDSSF